MAYGPIQNCMSTKWQIAVVFKFAFLCSKEPLRKVRLRPLTKFLFSYKWGRYMLSMFFDKSTGRKMEVRPLLSSLI